MAENKYIIRRAFKSSGIQYVPGMMFEDVSDIKRFRSKLADRKILRIPPVADTEAREEMEYYFRVRIGVPVDFSAGSEEGGKAGKAKSQVQPLKTEEAQPNPDTTSGTSVEKSAAELLRDLKKK